ncbi:hypothetical protein ACYOEI_00125 [Singulisphaera rosea]
MNSESFDAYAAEIKTMCREAGLPLDPGTFVLLSNVLTNKLPSRDEIRVWISKIKSNPEAIRELVDRHGRAMVVDFLEVVETL